MRTVTLWNDEWQFIQENVAPEEAAAAAGKAVTLPHTWNARDGQDGGNDYYRGACWYVKRFGRPAASEDRREVWVEFRGAAMTAEVWLNGKKLARHEGGYSTFRVDLTEMLAEENTLCVSVDNGKNRTVYPQKADFTFYGGIYRDVYLLTVPAGHFALDHHGGPGIKVTPDVSEDLQAAEVTVETWQTADGPVTVAVGEQRQTVESRGGYAKAVFHLERPRLWNGVDDPYLYTAEASLESGDSISVRFGCRRFRMDPERGFILNNRPLRLCGAARHQDREGVGNALTREMHEEDMELIREMGCNTVRLAHYQHDQYFYELCDQYGLAVWAEIPYITEHMPEARQNTLDQMTELVVQNYNHPSIICWGLSNEITGAGGVTEDLVDNHWQLNDLCHRLDPTRPTTMAHVFMLDANDPFVMLPDIRSYNLYYGWYVGEPEQNDQWFDAFHRNHPEAVIGLSEYGADANPAYQSGRPEKGDWTEGYQALYHEHMLKMWSERPYIWAMHVWNMFDFGADGRDEGGKPGQNQKGLVTFDRKTKKDAFYLYKAYLSRQPFVHICGGNYVERTEAETEIKVYSNQPEVTLSVDGRTVASQSGDKIFRFHVPISGKHSIEARAGQCVSAILVKKVDRPNPDYVKPGSGIVNWFDREDEIVREGYFSIKDSMGDVKAHPGAAAVLNEILAPLQAKAVAAYGEVAQNIQIPPEMQAMMDRMSVEASLKQMGGLVTPDVVHRLNGALNQIERQGQ